MDTKTKNALLALGSTKEEVAKTLKQLGLKGQPGSSVRDVIGTYLVSLGMLGFNSWFYNDWSKTEGKAAYDFIHDFDMRRYPDMIEEQ